MELVLAGESRPDTTDLDRRKPMSGWQMHGLKAAFKTTAQTMELPELVAISRASNDITAGGRKVEGSKNSGSRQSWV